MILEYKLYAQDFLDFQMFTASKSVRINRKKRNGWILLTLGSIAIAVNFFLKENTASAIYFLVTGILCGIFYPKYFKWKFKRHYMKNIMENYSKRFGEVELLEISNDFIFAKDKTGEGKINLAEIERVDETDNHFFLRMSTGSALVIPKAELENVDGLRDKFKEIGLTIVDETNWAWK